MGLSEGQRSCQAFPEAGRLARNPNNPTEPAWQPYSDARRATMVVDLECRQEIAPGGRARAALSAVPPFSYDNPLEALTKD